MPQPRTEMMVDELMPDFLAHRKKTKSPTTVEKEVRRARIIAAVFKGRLVSDITTRDILEYVDNRIKAGLSNRGMNLEITLVRSFFRFAITQGVVCHNPAREVENLPEMQREQWIPSQEEFASFVGAAAQTSTAKYIVPWIWLRAYTGMRPRESFFLEWDDIDFSKKQIRIRPKPGNPIKNRRIRHVEIHAELEPILRDWYQE